MSVLEQLFRGHLALAASDFNAWLQLLDEDILLEFPCAELACNPNAFRVKTSVAEVVRAFPDQVPWPRESLEHPGNDRLRIVAKLEKAVDTGRVAAAYVQAACG